VRVDLVGAGCGFIRDSSPCASIGWWACATRRLSSILWRHVRRFDGSTVLIIHRRRRHTRDHPGGSSGEAREHDRASRARDLLVRRWHLHWCYHCCCDRCWCPGGSHGGVLRRSCPRDLCRLDVLGPVARGWSLNDSPIDLLITANGVPSGNVWYLVRDNPRNAGCTGRLGLVDCTTASAAAPTYFEPWTIEELGAVLGKHRAPRAFSRTFHRSVSCCSITRVDADHIIALTVRSFTGRLPRPFLPRPSL
jgi:hypothetical protein